MRSRRLRTVALLGSTLAAGCAGDASLKLPEPAPDADLAFAALYDGEGPSRIGEIVRRQALYAGRYAVRGPSGLEARLYFLRSEDLTAAGRAACAAEPSAVERLSCEERVDACAAEPEGCWRAAPSGEGCLDRLPLGPDVPVLGYVAEADALEPGASGPPPGIALCGPPARLACPSRRAGYLVSSGGAFACVADVQQQSCAITIDLSGCGLPDVVGELDDAGALTNQQAGTCAIAPASSSPLLGVPGDLAVTCAGATYTLHPQDGLLASAGCPRRGPGIYETELGRSGRITGVVIRPGQTVPRIYLNGYGADACAREGCSIASDIGGNAGREGICNRRCVESCVGLFSIGPCARDGWASCVPVGEQETCLDRCEDACNLPEGAPCFSDALGLALTAIAPDDPERDLVRVGLDARSSLPAEGAPSLAAPGGPWLVAVTEAEVSAHEITGANLVEARGVAPLRFRGAGVVTSAEDGVAVFGEDVDGVQVQAFALSRGAEPRFTEVEATIALPDLAGPDVAARGGPQGQWVFVAATSPRLGRPDANRVGVASIRDGAALPTVEVPGLVTTLATLPGGAVLAGYAADRGDGGLAVLEPGNGRIAEVHTQPLPGGLRLTAAALDAETCDRPAPRACQVWLGFERTSGTGPALLGAARYDATDPGPLMWQGRLTRTAGQSLSEIAVDEAEGTAWAIAGTRNLLTPLSLWR